MGLQRLYKSGDQKISEKKEIKGGKECLLFCKI
jgi:hypothetical protein